MNIKIGDSAVWTRPDGSSQSVKILSKTVAHYGPKDWRAQYRVKWKTGPTTEKEGIALESELTPFPPGENLLTI